MATTARFHSFANSRSNNISNMGNCFRKIKEQEEEITTLKDLQAKKDERIQELEEENLNLKQEREGLLPQVWLLRENLHQAGWISNPETPTISYSYFV